MGEITTVYAQGLRYKRFQGWEPFYRLYFQTVHGMTDIVEGPTKNPWYEITDERLRVRDVIPAAHMCLILPQELTPLSPDVHPDDNYIQVSIEKQKLTAFEGDTPVYQAAVSTGVHTEGPTINGIPTDTPLGRFTSATKCPPAIWGMGPSAMTLMLTSFPVCPGTCFRFNQDRLPRGFLARQF